MKKDTKAKTEKLVKKEKCSCPYCDAEMVATSSPLCGGCGVAFIKCTVCGSTVLDKNAKKCPECGKPLK